LLDAGGGCGAAAVTGYGLFSSTGPGGFLLWLGVWILVLFAAYNIFDRLAGEDPGETLKKRLARGEISQEQFEQLKKQVATGVDADSEKTLATVPADAELEPNAKEAIKTE